MSSTQWLTRETACRGSRRRSCPTRSNPAPSAESVRRRVGGPGKGMHLVDRGRRADPVEQQAERLGGEAPALELGQHHPPDLVDLAPSPSLGQTPIVPAAGPPGSGTTLNHQSPSPLGRARRSCDRRIASGSPGRRARASPRGRSPAPRSAAKSPSAVGAQLHGRAKDSGRGAAGGSAISSGFVDQRGVGDLDRAAGRAGRGRRSRTGACSPATRPAGPTSRPCPSSER